MSVPLKAGDVYTRSAKPAPAKKNRTYLLLFLVWFFLIACGVWGTKIYSDHLRDQITQRISRETGVQLEAIRKDYEAQVSDLRTTVQSDMSNLQAKVDSLTELLAFIKDSANSNTDNSNQLYTQLTEVKQQLEELKQSLDVLK